MPALDVTLMIVPDWRWRMWGEMARLTTITPKVFVSNTSLITSSEVTSCAPNKPIPALFTTASIFPNRKL
jgi:hypothetical protein